MFDFVVLRDWRSFCGGDEQSLWTVLGRFKEGMWRGPGGSRSGPSAVLAQVSKQQALVQLPDNEPRLPSFSINFFPNPLFRSPSWLAMVPGGLAAKK